MKHVARKRFGQHFLIDAGVIEDLVAAMAPDRHDLMVEIGPGLGALMRPLMRALEVAGGQPLHVIELDRDLVARLKAQAASTSALVVHQADALTFDFASLLAPGQRLRMVGNLPYNISSPLLFHLASLAHCVRDQHFMLQREVVERMTAAPGQPAFGRLSVMLQIQYRMEHLFDVAPACFDPPPKVTSAVVRMIPEQSLADTLTDRTLFAELVAQAFSQRRKMLRNTLAGYERWVPLEAAGIAPTARAEEISAATYVDYANRLTASGAGVSLRSISSIL